MEISDSSSIGFIPFITRILDYFTFGVSGGVLSAETSTSGCGNPSLPGVLNTSLIIGGDSSDSTLIASIGVGELILDTSVIVGAALLCVTWLECVA